MFRPANEVFPVAYTTSHIFGRRFGVRIPISVNEFEKRKSCGKLGTVKRGRKRQIVWRCRFGDGFAEHRYEVPTEVVVGVIGKSVPNQFRHQKSHSLRG